MTAPETIETIESRNPCLRDISAEQWKSGLAAWLGLAVRRPGYAPLYAGRDAVRRGVARPCPTRATRACACTVRGSRRRSCSAGRWAAGCSAGSAIGWGGAGLCLTILTYALFTGLSSVAQTWWQLLIFRFLAALGIGGEWAVGASLLSETWPRRWRPWIAAVLQSGVNVGHPAGLGRRLPDGRRESPASSSWSACCRPGWCSGSAARSPSRTSGSRPPHRPGRGRPRSATCSSPACAASPSWSSSSARAR